MRFKLIRARPAGPALGRAADPREHGPQGAERGAQRDPAHATASSTRCTISGSSPVVGGAVDVDAVRENFQDLFSGVWAGPAGERRLQPPGPGRRAEPAPDRDPARLLQVHAADRHAVQPGLCRADAGSQPRPRRATWPACSTRASTRRTASAAASVADRASRSGIADAAQPGREPRPGPHPPALSGADQGDPAHQCLAARSGQRAGQGLRLLQVRPARRSRACRRRGRRSRSSSTRPTSRACICAAARSRAAACAGPTGARISAPRSWA